VYLTYDFSSFLKNNLRNGEKWENDLIPRKCTSKEN